LRLRFWKQPKELQKIAKQVAQIVEKTEGTADVFDGIVYWAIDVTPKYNQLSQYGITPANLQFQLQTLLEGNVIGSILELDKVPIRMIYPNTQNRNLEEIRKTLSFTKWKIDSYH
jgi:Cu/Ag efflux pump CusA